MARRSVLALGRFEATPLPRRPRRSADDAGLPPPAAVIDCLSSSPKYRSHLGPVWQALPGELRGQFVELDARSPRLAFAPVLRKGDVALVASYMDMRAARRHGYGRIALLEHGIGQSYGSRDPHLPGGDDRGPVGLFLSPNETAAARDAERYPKARVVVVGSTVLDALPGREPGPAPVIAITWHWHYTRIPEMRSAFEHFRDVLDEFAAAYQVIGHAHPQAAGMVTPTYRRLGIEYEPDYGGLFRRADVLVADNTSALFEFASTGRPVALLNAPEYRRDVEHGLRFWRAADIGIQVHEPEQLVAGVAEALADRSARKAARRAALRVAYAYPKGAAKRAARALTEWLA